MIFQFLDTESNVNSWYKLECITTFAGLKYFVVFSLFINDRNFAFDDIFCRFPFSVIWKVNLWYSIKKVYQMLF